MAEPIYPHGDEYLEIAMLVVGQLFEHPDPDAGPTEVVEVDINNEQVIPKSGRPLAFDEGYVRAVHERTTK
jgi:hypothetical protein